MAFTLQHKSLSPKGFFLCELILMHTHTETHTCAYESTHPHRRDEETPANSPVPFDQGPLPLGNRGPMQ